jgi:hypothetical protein
MFIPELALTVLVFLYELILTAVIFPPELAFPARMFLTEIALTYFMCYQAQGDFLLQRIFL